MKFERLTAKVGSIDTDEMTAILEFGCCEWYEEYRYTPDTEHVLVECILNNTEVNVLTEEKKKSKRIIEAEYAMEEED